MRLVTVVVCVEIAVYHPTLPCGVTERVCLRQKATYTARIQSANPTMKDDETIRGGVGLPQCDSPTGEKEVPLGRL